MSSTGSISQTLGVGAGGHLANNPGSTTSGSSGDYSVSRINKMLAAAGISQKDVFMVFYFIITNIFMGGITQASNSNTDHLANLLSKDSNNLTLWNNFKHTWFAAANRNASPTQVDQAFRAAAGKMLNGIFGKWLQTHGNGELFSENGSVLSALKYTRLFDAFAGINKMSNQEMEYYCPALGSHAASILSSIEGSGDNASGDPMRYFFAGVNGQCASLYQWWGDVQTGSGMANPKHLPNSGSLPAPQMMSTAVNALSEGGTTISGISGIEAEKLQYNQQTFNRLQAFIKNSLSSWISQRKNFNNAMGKANS